MPAGQEQPVTSTCARVKTVAGDEGKGTEGSAACRATRNIQPPTAHETREAACRRLARRRRANPPARAGRAARVFIGRPVAVAPGPGGRDAVAAGRRQAGRQWARGGDGTGRGRSAAAGARAEPLTTARRRSVAGGRTASCT
ncbi:hypothetical protein PAHAL_4G063000 [Panicum hallii]|uniref:Uncharacterized protein n=1 Tax=Panicum hallii TaxID=206008 RepID=A0A2T8JBX9_9POAL|nr:hypothetical protein PAHAL_4G063000 [Panicum hallii]